MARKLRPVTKKRKTESGRLPLTRTNYMILGIGLIVIVLGYVALAQKPWDGFMPLVAAPILLVLGYCVVIPAGILFRKKEKPAQEPVTPADQAS